MFLRGHKMRKAIKRRNTNSKNLLLLRLCSYIIVLTCAKRHMRCRGMEKLFKRLVLLCDEDY